MQTVTLDFETYFDSEYSLRSKMNTSEYVRDDRYKTQCVGIKLDANPVVWVSHENVEEALATIDWGNSALLCHHTQFDGFILTERYGHRPAYYLDTLSMGRALHGVGVGGSLNALAGYYKLGNKIPDVLGKTKGVRDIPPDLMHELGTYCAMDVELTYRLYQCMLPEFRKDELDLINMTVRMFCEPSLHVDLPLVEEELNNEQLHKQTLIESCGVPATTLQSNEQFAQELRKRGVEPPTKISPRTGKTAYAFSKTDVGFTNLLESRDQAIVDLVRARLAVKSTIGETRAQRFALAGSGGRSLPIYLKYYGAHTGRWSAGNKMNMQNLPRDGNLRRAIVAPPGYVICVVDSAQIEARMLAWVANDRPLLMQFTKGEDVYKNMASHIYHKPVEEIIKGERFVGKIAILGLGYQMGAPKFQDTLQSGAMGPPTNISMTEAHNVVVAYRAKRSAIVRFWHECEVVLRQMYVNAGSSTRTLGRDDILTVDKGKNTIRLPNGMHLQYPGLTCDFDPVSEHMKNFRYFDYENAVKLRMGLMPDWKKAKKIYGGVMTENIVQALARLVVSDQMREIDQRYRVVSMTHDEVIALVPENEADKGLKFMEDVMRKPPQWATDLPLDAEGGYAKNYSK